MLFAAGNGYYVGGIIVTIFSLLILTFLRYFEAMITKKSLTITCIGHANLPVIGTILKICDKYETQIKDLQSSLVEYEGKECIKVSFGFMNPHTPKVVVNAIVDEINESILPVSLFVRKY